MMMFKFNKNEVERAINLLHEDGSIFEIRLINNRYNASGYFNDAKTAINALESFRPQYSSKRDVVANSNVFITLNPCHTACFSRKQKNKLVEYAEPTTKDSEITHLNNLLIDIDPIRVSGVSSSDEELKKAKDKAIEIKTYLKSKGFQNPIFALSGNGAHLVYKFNAKNSSSNVELFKTFLEYISDLFSDDCVDIDRKVYNPARLCKLWGTYAHKGQDDPQNNRGHRLSQILEESNSVNDISLLKQFKLQEEEMVNKPIDKKKHSSKFNLEDFIDRNNIRVRSVERKLDGTYYILESCLFDSSHTGKDAAIIERSDGTLCYNCFHNHCSDKHWSDVRDMFEPKSYQNSSKKKRSYQSQQSVDDSKSRLTLDKFRDWINSKYKVGFDVVSHEAFFNGVNRGTYEPLINNTFPTYLESELEKEFRDVSYYKILRFLDVVIAEKAENKLLQSIKDTKWDGEDRIEELYRILDIDESDSLSRVFIHKWLIQAVAMLHNGDNGVNFAPEFVLVLQGAQGIGKTRIFQHLVPAKYFGEGETIDPRDKDTVLRVTSKWICELGEVGSTLKKDVDIIKAFLTRGDDECRPPYGRISVKYPRKTTFVGTVNEPEFLIDPTGNRRWAVVPLKPDLKIDYEGQIEPFDSMQLWAQIYAEIQQMINEKGYNITNCFRLTNKELKASNERNIQHEKQLKGEQEVIDVLDDQMTRDPGSTIYWKEMTTTEFIDKNPVLRKYHAIEIAKVLNKHGYEQFKKNIFIDGIRTTKKVRRLPYKLFCKK